MAKIMFVQRAEQLRRLGMTDADVMELLERPDCTFDATNADDTDNGQLTLLQTVIATNKLVQRAHQFSEGQRRLREENGKLQSIVVKIALD